jgi:predicted regulator of Ras-like GTPase activity (Roadblock/LC7/MglB family)
MNPSTAKALSDSEKNLAQVEAQGILDDVAGVTAVVIATVDGFDVASVLRNGLNPSRIAALASSIASIGEVVSGEALLGRSKSLTVNTESGVAVIHNVYRHEIGLVVIVVASGDAILAQLNYRTNAAVSRLALA